MSQNTKNDLGKVLGLILGQEKMSIELHPWRGHGDVEAADALVLHAPVRRREHHSPLRLVRVRDLGNTVMNL